MIEERRQTPYINRSTFLYMVGVGGAALGVGYLGGKWYDRQLDSFKPEKCGNENFQDHLDQCVNNGGEADLHLDVIGRAVKTENLRGLELSQTSITVLQGAHETVNKLLEENKRLKVVTWKDPNIRRALTLYSDRPNRKYGLVIPQVTQPNANERMKSIVHESTHIYYLETEVNPPIGLYKDEARVDFRSELAWLALDRATEQESLAGPEMMYHFGMDYRYVAYALDLAGLQPETSQLYHYLFTQGFKKANEINIVGINNRLETSELLLTKAFGVDPRTGYQQGIASLEAENVEIDKIWRGVVWSPMEEMMLNYLANDPKITEPGFISGFRGLGKG